MILKTSASSSPHSGLFVTSLKAKAVRSEPRSSGPEIEDGLSDGERAKVSLIADIREEATKEKERSQLSSGTSSLQDRSNEQLPLPKSASSVTARRSEFNIRNQQGAANVLTMSGDSAKGTMARSGEEMQTQSPTVSQPSPRRSSYKVKAATIPALTDSMPDGGRIASARNRLQSPDESKSNFRSPEDSRNLSKATVPAGIKITTQLKSRKLLPTMKTAEPAKRFKNLAIQNRVQKHRRSEPAPNLDNLIFMDPTTGKNLKGNNQSLPAVTASTESHCHDKEPIQMSEVVDSIIGDTQLNVSGLASEPNNTSEAPQAAAAEISQIGRLLTQGPIAKPLATDMAMTESPSITQQAYKFSVSTPSNIAPKPPPNAPTGPKEAESTSATLFLQRSHPRLDLFTGRSAVTGDYPSLGSYDNSKFSLMYTPSKQQRLDLWSSIQPVHIIADMRLARSEADDWEVLKVKLLCISGEIQKMILALKTGPSTLNLDFRKSILACDYAKYFSTVRTMGLLCDIKLTFFRMLPSILDRVAYALIVSMKQRSGIGQKR